MSLHIPVLLDTRVVAGAGRGCTGPPIGPASQAHLSSSSPTVGPAPARWSRPSSSVPT